MMSSTSKNTRSFRSRSRSLQQSYLAFSTDEKEEPLSNSNNLQKSFSNVSGMSSAELNTFAENKNISNDNLNSMIWCFHYKKWDSGFFAKAKSNDKVYFRNTLSKLCDISAGAAGYLWRKCVDYTNSNIETSNVNDDIVHTSDIQPEQNDNDDWYEEWKKCFEQTEPNTTNDQLTPNQQNVFSSMPNNNENDQNQSQNQINFNMNNMNDLNINANDMNNSNHNNLMQLQQTQQTQVQQHQLQPSTLQNQTQQQGNYNNIIDNIFIGDIDIVNVSDIKQEEETDLDLSFLAALNSSTNNTVPIIPVLNRINSVEDIATELIYNRWHKDEEKEGSYFIKYINAYNKECIIRFDYKPVRNPSTKKEKKYKKKGSKWKRWYKYEGIWTTDANVAKRVDIHIHVNVKTKETCVNIELYPNPYSPTGETYWDQKLRDIGKMFPNKTNKYVCSKWITNYMRNMLK